VAVREISSCARFCAGVVAGRGQSRVAVAYAAQRLGVRARIFVRRSLAAKIARIRESAAELVIGGDCYADAFAASEVVAQTGAVPCTLSIRSRRCSDRARSPWSSPLRPGLDTLLVRRRSGSSAGSRRAPGNESHRVEPEEAPTLTEALRAGRSSTRRPAYRRGFAGAPSCR